MRIAARANKKLPVINVWFGISDFQRFFLQKICNIKSLYESVIMMDRIAREKPYSDKTAEEIDREINELIEEQGAVPNIPPKANRKGTFVFSGWVYRQRNLVERFFNRIKQFRGIATRYDKDPANFLAAVKLVATLIWCAGLCGLM